MRSSLNILRFTALLFPIFMSTSCTDDPIEIPEPDTTAPQSMVLFPVDGESVSGEVIIQVRAVDNDRVDSVQFLINQVLVFTDSTDNDNIFTFKWNTNENVTADGITSKLYSEDDYHYISAIAYDPVGNSYASVPIRSLVDNIDNEAPVAFFLSPFAGQFVSGVVNIEVIASDNDSIQYVSYFVNNILQGYVQERPFVFPWNTNLVQSSSYYSIHANVKDVSNNNTTIAPISVYVDNGIANDIIPPTGSIVSPPAGMTVSGLVQIIVSANDDRAMGEVALSINGVYTATIDNAPYAYVWNTSSAEEDAEHIISVILVDLSGNETPLNPISVFVDNELPLDSQAPVVMIMEPAAGQDVSGMVDIEVMAEDDTGIDYIEFFINGLSTNIDTLAPYVYEWDTRGFEDDSEHLIAVIGYDIQGNSTLATPIAVYVDNFDNVSPSGQIQNPVPGQIVSGTVEISVVASDNVGIRDIELSIDGIPRDTLFEEPYTYNWDTTQESEDRDHVISVIVSDTSGNVGHVLPISVFVDNIINDDSPPVGIISSPLSGQVVSGNVNFTVESQDENGISEIQFSINGSIVETVFDVFSHTYIWDTTLLDNGSEHSLSSSITDYFGNTSLLQPVLVRVQN